MCTRPAKVIAASSGLQSPEFIHLLGFYLRYVCKTDAATITVYAFGLVAVIFVKFCFVASAAVHTAAVYSMFSISPCDCRDTGANLGG